MYRQKKRSINRPNIRLFLTGLKPTLGDKILYIVILTTAVLLWSLPIAARLLKQNELTAVVQYKGERMQEVSLNQNDRMGSFYFNGLKAYYEIEDQRFRLLPMEKEICPEGICSDIGWIGAPWQSIVCIPNQLVVRIEGGQSPDDLDAVAY